MQWAPTVCGRPCPSGPPSFARRSRSDPCRDRCLRSRFRCARNDGCVSSSTIIDPSERSPDASAEGWGGAPVSTEGIGVCHPVRRAHDLLGHFYLGRGRHCEERGDGTIHGPAQACARNDRWLGDGVGPRSNISEQSHVIASYPPALGRPRLLNLLSFHVCALLHDPIYREKYALNLKREFPRVPYYPDFWRWAEWGKANGAAYWLRDRRALAAQTLGREDQNSARRPRAAILRADKDNES